MSDEGRLDEVDANVRHLDLVVGRAPFGVAYLDGALRVRWVNAAFAALSSAEPADLRGRALEEIYPELDVEVEELARAVLSGEQGSGEHLLRGPSDTGLGTPSYQLTVFPVAGEDESPNGLMAALTESTTEVEASAQLAIATQRLHLLSELGGQLSATLDVDRIVQLATDLLAPVLGDACAVEAREDDEPQTDQVVRAVSVSGGHRAAATSVAAPSPPVQEVMRSAEVIRYANVPAGVLDELDEDRPGQSLVVPMRARGQVVGALVLARFGSYRTYDDDEVGLAVEVAGRIGMAVDNARLFARQRDVAVTLQHTLLPHRLPELPGVDIAARYIAGSAETEVGGDWFDVTPLPDGTLALVIGDVMGRGVRAAAVMGQLRAAVRAYTVLGLAPSRLLAYLDRVVGSLDQVQLVTCLYGVLDPSTGAFRYAKAGHHPPLLRLADGTVSWLESPDSPPLGVLEMASTSPVERAIRIPTGATLLFYTDGLVEERHTDLGVRERRLADGFANTEGQPEEVVDALLAAMGRTGEQHDDIALLAVHLPTAAERDVGPPEHEARLTVTGEPGSVSDARHFLSSVLAGWDLRSLVDTAALLVSETVTNALRHARSAADVRVHKTGAGVEIEVRDLDARIPTPRVVDVDSESGRGLNLLNELSAEWGAEPSPAGKRVWFRLELPRDR